MQEMEEDMPPKIQHSITASSRVTAKQSETLLWGALCERVKKAKRYIAPDCVMVNPLISPRGDYEPFGTGEPGVPSVLEALDSLVEVNGRSPPFRAYSFSMETKGEPVDSFVQTSLMSITIMYSMSVVAYERQPPPDSEDEEEEYDDDGYAEGEEEVVDDEGDSTPAGTTAGSSTGEAAASGAPRRRRVVRAHVASTWKQGSNGKWLLCCQHFIPEDW